MFFNLRNGSSVIINRIFYEVPLWCSSHPGGAVMIYVNVRLIASLCMCRHKSSLYIQRTLPPSPNAQISTCRLLIGVSYHATRECNKLIFNIVNFQEAFALGLLYRESRKGVVYLQGVSSHLFTAKLISWRLNVLWSIRVLKNGKLRVDCDQGAYMLVVRELAVRLYIYIYIKKDSWLEINSWPGDFCFFLSLSKNEEFKRGLISFARARWRFLIGWSRPLAVSESPTVPTMCLLAQFARQTSLPSWTTKKSTWINIHV